MIIVADTHVHLYSVYKLPAVLSAAFSNLTALVEAAPTEFKTNGSSGTVKILCLTERAGTNFFAALRSGKIELGPDYTVHDHGGAALLITRINEADAILVFAGRQVVTREKLEMLVLATERQIQDGLPLADSLSKAVESGGIAVLNWSPGKWLFGRGRAVKKAILGAQPGTLVVGDCAMRPISWGEPALFALARKRGIPIIAGSDPLPFAGEESKIGTYGLVGKSDFNWRDPAGDFRNLIFGTNRYTIVGSRDPFGVALDRWKRNRAAKSTTVSMLNVAQAEGV